MKYISSFAFRYSKFIITVVFFLTLFFGYFMKDLRLNGDYLTYLPKRDPLVQTFTRLDTRFNGSALILAAYRVDSIFTNDSLRTLDRVTQAIRLADGVTSVTSLTNILDIKKGEDGSIEISKLLDPEKIPATDMEMEAFRRYVMSKDRYRGNVVSEDGTAALVMCQLRPGIDQQAVVKNIKKAIKDSGLSAPVNLGGTPFAASETIAMATRDMGVLIPIIALLVVCTLFLNFRHFRGIFIPLLSVIISAIWTLGTVVLCGSELSAISNIIPVLLIAIGSAPGIHILSKFDENTNLYGNRKSEAKTAFEEVGLRVFLTTITIIIGFASFIGGAYLVPIRDFGLFSAIGFFYVLLISLLFVPALLAIISVKPSQKKGGVVANVQASSPLKQAAMVGLANWISRHPRLIVISGIVLFVLGLLGIPQIHKSGDIIEMFPIDSPVRLTDQLLQKSFGGSAAIQAYFQGDMQNPFILQAMLRTERFMEGHGYTRAAISVADMIAEMNDIMDNKRVVPDARDKIANLMFLLEGQEGISQMLHEDKTDGQIQAMIPSLKSEELNAMIKNINQFLDEMPKKLAVVSFSSLDAQDRELVMRDRLKWTKNVLKWLAQKRKTGIQVDESALLAQLTGIYLNTSGKVQSDDVAQKILPIFTVDLQSVPAFVDDVKAELAYLSQNNVAIPENLYQKLSPTSRKVAPEFVEFKATLSGLPLILAQINSSLAGCLVESALIALISIFIILAIKLKSWVAGLLGVMPIVIVVISLAGIMGFAKIPLDIATALIGSVAMGIGIDYIIHFSVRFTTYCCRPEEAAEAIQKTMETTGVAIITNVLVVTFGFAILMLANMVPLQRFGELVCASMILSGVGALTMLPAIILLTPSAWTKKVAPTCEPVTRSEEHVRI